MSRELFSEDTTAPNSLGVSEEKIETNKCVKPYILLRSDEAGDGHERSSTQQVEIWHEGVAWSLQAPYLNLAHVVESHQFCQNLIRATEAA